ncbi:MAG TPA: phenylalanine--tRNA ligase subunit beta [Thermoanaerobaculia bacterium]|jgi:phenylalanyl-tRNA synthetase beta chain|nr:phenylalanine--tRNA ligase subunit beta [Thermoanaerobaculia bacterium]
MEFSCAWLAEYVDLPAEPQELARRLTAAGFAVEGMKASPGNPDDTVLDVDVTTNRPDAMNHFGLAREIATILGVPLRRPPAAPAEGPEPVGDAARVTVEDVEGCPRFAARVVRGVRVGPSPDWLRRRLEAIGLRSISNVVDVTNFILWELGQPLHAYDLAKLAGNAIVVRRARAGERLTTLDGVERELDPEVLVIADAERPVGLGGVMGGLDSEVTGDTRDILIEGAHFDRKRVRAAARRFGLHTDASHRFERGADAEICVEAVSRAAALIAEVAGGTVLAGAFDVHDPTRSWHRHGRLDLAKLDAFAGARIAAADAERWLTGLGFGIDREAQDGAWRITVPSWRYYDFSPRPEPPHDVYAQDLYEEVIRHYGIDRIEAALPAIPGADAPRPAYQIRRERARRQLAASGYVETIHFAFLDPARDAAFPSLRPEAKAMRLANPLSEQYSVLRRSLVPNLVETARFNQRRGLAAVRMFEIATVFYDVGAGEIPHQPEHLGLVCGGRLGSPWQREVELDLFDLKGTVEALAHDFGIRLEIRPADLPGLLAGNAAELLLDGGAVGYLGRVAAEEGYPLYVAELATAALAGGNPSLAIAIPSRHPGISADFTLTHALVASWAEIDGAIRDLAPADLTAWELKVRYRGQGVPDGAVKTTISFFYNARERSLTQEEVNARQLGLSQELERRFGWKG